MTPCRRLSLAAAVAALSLLPAPFAKAQQGDPPGPGPVFCPRETDANSPRHTRLQSATPDGEIVRYSLTGNTDHPDVIETWLNGKRVRWIGEGGRMKWTDVRGNESDDAMQIDRDGDGYYDGPGDLNIKWVDDDGDGRPDVQIFAANPAPDAKSTHSGMSHFMVFVDEDHDGVNGYIDWNTFEFRQANWRVPPTTSPARPRPDPNFSPDYCGDSTFLKQHLPAWCVTDIRYNWENPFLFFDFDKDGCTEMAMRLLDTTEKAKEATPELPLETYRKMDNEAFVTWDLDNDSQRHNEMDYDMTLRFASEADGSKGERLDYSGYHNPHKMKAPQWVLDAKLFRFDNWRKIDEFIYLSHDKAYDAIWPVKWAECWLSFDEDDDDHRWERVELQYPTDNYYGTGHWDKEKKGGGLGAHVQADTLGDRGEWDRDNSGRGQLYVGAWDHKVHLFGAEKGGWAVDKDAKYWGATFPVGDSSPDMAPKVEEVVSYEDTDGNGYFDKITYDYDGDKKPDLVINLLDYKSAANPHPDVRDLMKPGDMKWQGMHDMFIQIARDSFQDAHKVYQAAWKKGLTDTDMDNMYFASSTWEQYDHGYWLKENIFRKLDKQLADDKDRQAKLRQAYFTGDIPGVVAVIDSLDPQPQKK